MTYTSIFVCDPKKIKIGELPDSVLDLSEKFSSNDYLSLWTLICRNGKRIEQCSHYIEVTRQELEKLAQGFLPQGRS